MRFFQVDVRKESTAYGFMPIMKLYLLEDTSLLRPIVLMAPGGGYTRICEDEKIVAEYHAAGFHVAVLHYCVEPHHFPEPQKDMLLAIRLLRENAAEWGIMKNQIAICGFSAGGHLCASVSTLWSRSGDEIYRPDAAILCFGILTARIEHCKRFLQDHIGCEDEEKLALVSCDRQVTKDTPPTFLYGTFEDTLTNVENVLYYAESLSSSKVPFEMHVFPKGEHGASWCDKAIWAKQVRGRDYNYIRLSVEWLRELFGLL